MADLEQPTTQRIQEQLHYKQDTENGLEQSHANESMRTANSTQPAIDELGQGQQSLRGPISARNKRHSTGERPDDPDQQPLPYEQATVDRLESSPASRPVRTTNSAQPRSSRPGSQSTPRKIVVCCDGTTNDDVNEKKITNVVRFARCIAPVDEHGVTQLVYYQRGVGTKRGFWRNTRETVTGKGKFARIYLQAKEFTSWLGCVNKVLISQRF